MNSVDVIIIVVLLASTALGLYWGMIRQVLSLLGLVAGVVLANRYGSDVADLAASIFFDSALNQAIGFVVVVVVVSSLISALASLLHRFVGLLFLGWLDHLAGGLLGFIQASVGCTVMLAVAATFPSDLWVGALGQSQIAPLLIRAFGAVLHILPEPFRFASQLVYLGRAGP